MVKGRFQRALVLAAALVFSLTSIAHSAEDHDAEIRHALVELHSPDEAVRKEALAGLARLRDGRLAALLNAYLEGSLYLWKDQPVYCRQIKPPNDSGVRLAPLSDPLTRQRLEADGQPVEVPKSELKDLTVARADRAQVRDAMALLELWSDQPDQQLSAVQKAGNSGNPALIAPLQEVAGQAATDKIRRSAEESIELLRLSGNVPDETLDDRLAAARRLGELHTARAGPVLQELLKQLDAKPEKTSADVATRETYQHALNQVESYARWVRGFDYLKSGLSRGSILILMALGLSITFGLMGVINMAHGELMMIGAYATYVTQQVFVQRLPESLFNWYFIVALPISFLVAALFGFLIEYLVVRHLYNRPLETLLATWGVSLILIQAVQTKFGSNIAVNNPTWLRGGAEIMPDMVLPYNRCFIFVLTAFCVLLIYGLMNFTELGLRARATMQNREMANALGVNTRRIDGYTFALGAGIAGVAGYALTLVGNVTPNMGQSYIVESFLVVVTGGVGELWGAIYAGMGLGVLNKVLEPSVGAVLGQVLILVAVILFIQRRPAGLFPPKGRLADV